mgnify:CR=1 FL=1
MRDLLKRLKSGDATKQEYGLYRKMLQALKNYGFKIGTSTESDNFIIGTCSLHVHNGGLREFKVKDEVILTWTNADGTIGLVGSEPKYVITIKWKEI